MSTEETQSVNSQDVIESIEHISSSLSDIKEYLRNIEEILRMLVEPIAEQSLRDIFDDPRKIRVYELANGLRSTRDIASFVNVSQRTVSNWLNDMEEQHNIVDRIGERGQYKRKYLLIDLLLNQSQLSAYPVEQMDDHIYNDK